MFCKTSGTYISELYDIISCFELLFGQKLASDVMLYTKGAEAPEGALELWS